MRLALAQTNFKGDCRMNKKLLAVAVAGAFAAPAVALAQNSTVQVYGKVSIELGYADQGGGRPNTDSFMTPGGSAVGIKGEEKLGGGLSAWFQCENSADVRGLNQDGWCDRNSALGMKGGFGNVYFGKWDTPFKRAFVGQFGSTETGLGGSTFLLTGNSTGTGATGGQGASQSLSRNVWKRRETSLATYESPQFSGFQVLGAFNFANATSVTDGTTNAKPRIWSLAGTYSNGPLALALAYEKHVDFGSGFTGTGGDDRGWTVGASYTFMGNLQIGAQYVDYKYEMGGGTDVKKDNWIISGDWNISGPHHLMGNYVSAGKSKGTATTSPGGGNGTITAPLFVGNAVSAAAGLCAVGATCVVSGTGAYTWNIAYQYDFSKRTLARIGYINLHNDSAASYGLGGLGAVTPGSSQSAFFMYSEMKF
jgi:predicted porin